MDFHDDDDSTNWAWEQRCYELEIQGIDPDSLDEYDDDDDSEALTAAERNPSMLR